jgi:predicted Rossmann fold nucleotide-binding protein DprA/Smf involved in DNA uptake
MMMPLTPNTQAILLLTAPLIAGRHDSSAELLTFGEYNRLARMLRENQKQPADLIGSAAGGVIDLCAKVFGRPRLDALLGRGFLLSQAVDRWNARAIWVVSRADASYPRRFKTRLKEDAPPLLYGCGDADLLEKGGLAVVGSRHVDDELIAYTERVGRVAAKAHRTLISGAARGIDRAAMNGALQAGGTVVGVMSDSLERAAVASDNREPLMDKRLVLVSPYDPAAGFNVGHAMQRNKFIYALSDAALVVSADFQKGGTWEGAIEQLERLHFVPVFVRPGDNGGKGNRALIQRGGRPWPEPHSGGDLIEAMKAAAADVAAEPQQETLSFALREKMASSYGDKLPKPAMTPSVLESSSEQTGSPATRLLSSVRQILLQELAEAQTASQVAALLGVSKSQAKAWLIQLVKEGTLKKLSKPGRFRAAKSSGQFI